MRCPSLLARVKNKFYQVAELGRVHPGTFRRIDDALRIFAGWLVVKAVNYD